MRKGLRLFWLIVSVFCAAAAALACIYAGLFGPVFNQPAGDPQETVTLFFDSLKTGDYPAAYACLSDYQTLGLEQEPETAEARQVYDALKQSYSYILKGDCVINGNSAAQKVRFRALNLQRTEAAIASRVNGILEAKVAELPQAEIYDGEGGYLPSLTDAVYQEALEEVLKNTDSLAAETELEIALRYEQGEWRIVTDRALLSALVGGEA